jgi:hypothetical protein
MRPTRVVRVAVLGGHVASGGATLSSADTESRAQTEAGAPDALDAGHPLGHDTGHEGAPTSPAPPGARFHRRRRPQIARPPLPQPDRV